MDRRPDETDEKKSMDGPRSVPLAHQPSERAAKGRSTIVPNHPDTLGGRYARLALVDGTEAQRMPRFRSVPNQPAHCYVPWQYTFQFALMNASAKHPLAVRIYRDHDNLLLASVDHLPNAAQPADRQPMLVPATPLTFVDDDVTPTNDKPVRWLIRCELFKRRMTQTPSEVYCFYLCSALDERRIVDEPPNIPGDYAQPSAEARKAILERLRRDRKKSKDDPTTVTTVDVTSPQQAIELISAAAQDPTKIKIDVVDEAGNLLGPEQTAQKLDETLETIVDRQLKAYGCSLSPAMRDELVRRLRAQQQQGK